MKRRKPHSSALVLLVVLIFGFWWGVAVFAHYVRTGSEITAGGTAPLYYTAQHPLSVTYTRANDEIHYQGNFSLPSCEALGSGISYKGKNPSHVALMFMSSKSPVACAQAASEDKTPFELSIELKESDPLPVFDGVTLNGKTLPSTLAEATQ